MCIVEFLLCKSGFSKDGGCFCSKCKQGTFKAIRIERTFGQGRSRLMVEIALPLEQTWAAAWKVNINAPLSSKQVILIKSAIT